MPRPPFPSLIRFTTTALGTATVHQDLKIVKRTPAFPAMERSRFNAYIGFAATALGAAAIHQNLQIVKRTSAFLAIVTHGHLLGLS